MYKSIAFCLFITLSNFTLSHANQVNLVDRLSDERQHGYFSMPNEPENENVEIDLSDWEFFQLETGEYVRLPAKPKMEETAAGCLYKAIDREGMTFIIELTVGNFENLDLKNFAYFFVTAMQNMDTIQTFSFCRPTNDQYSHYTIAWCQDNGIATSITFIREGNSIYKLTTRTTHPIYIKCFQPKKHALNQEEFKILKKDFLKIETFIDSFHTNIYQ